MKAAIRVLRASQPNATAVKGPILRELAARAPYFHDGSAATLLDVVNFYDQRFGIGFTEQDRRDLATFLPSDDS